MMRDHHALLGIAGEAHPRSGGGAGRGGAGRGPTPGFARVGRGLHQPPEKNLPEKNLPMSP
jgi:hypothetical protein